AEHFGLGDVAREPVEQEPLHRVVLGETVADHANRDLVGYEVAGVHVLLRRDTQLRAFSDIRTENVTGGDLGDRPRRGDERGLRALACSRWSDQYETHYRRKPS